ncbi:MAG: ABC-type transporter Mla subunit MlaD [Candidatus Nitrosomirales archaeon]|jgi:ABC-type transporter Mla subunit MlaD
MTSRAKEKALEKIVPRLKENQARSEKFIKSDAIEPVNKKIDNIITHVKSLIKRKGTPLSLILNDLENIREDLTYYSDSINRATKDNDTYVFALETLYNEFSGGTSEIQPVKVARAPRESNGKTYKSLISDKMYEKIASTLKEKNITAFNTATGEKIGIPKTTLFRFVRVALQKGEITKTGKDQYEFASMAANSVT